MARADSEIIDAEVTEDSVTETEPSAPLAVVKARRTPSPLSRHYASDSPLAPAIDQLEKDLGGRAALLESLMGLPDAAGLDYVVGLLADPTSDARKLSAICHAGGISVGELLEAVKRGKLLAPTLKAMTAVAKQIPAVVDDVMLRAAPHYVACATCDGTGSCTDKAKPDDPPIPCEDCKAQGRVLVLPDLERQKVALELAGLGPKKGPQTLVNVDNRKQTAIGSMSDLIRQTDAVALRPAARTRPSTPDTSGVSGVSGVVDSPPMPEDPS